MSATVSRTLAIVAGLAVALSVAMPASAQTQTKERVPTGAAKVTKTEVKGEIVSVGDGWLVAKNHLNEHNVYIVEPGQKFVIDGAEMTLKDLKPGTKLTAQVTTTETPAVNRTTTVTEGTVFWASPKSVIVTLKNGENKQYAVPEGFTFNVEGKQLSAMELRQGMHLTATKIVEEPTTVISRNVVVTGTTKK